MQGLRHLSVALFIRASELPSDHEEMLLMPLKSLGDMMNVEVVVCWKRDRNRPVETQWPFMLRRKEIGLAGDFWRCNEDC